MAYLDNHSHTDILSCIRPGNRRRFASEASRHDHKTQKERVFQMESNWPKMVGKNLVMIKAKVLMLYAKNLEGRAIPAEVAVFAGKA